MESSSASLVATEEGFQPVFFEPRPLKNLLLIDEMASLMPITDMKVGEAFAGGVWAAGGVEGGFQPSQYTIPGCSPV